MPGYELIGNEELKEISQIFKKSKTLAKMGFEQSRKNIYKVKDFEKKFSKYIKSPYCLGVTSGTAALRVALATLDLKKNDEVIAPSFTFVATIEAIVESGAQPIIVDVDKTLNMAYAELVKKISKKTKAIIVVHMLGVPTDLIHIKKICKRKKIALIEDTAWGCGAKYKGKYLGTHGDMGAFSFDFAKTITTGEGGMAAFKNKKLFDKASAWHDHGHENNPKVPRWEDTRKSTGFNFRMNEMQGAVGLAQLKKINNILKKQRQNHDAIWNKIRKIPGIELREYPKSSFVSADALVFFVKNKKLAVNCRRELLKYKISTKILPEATTWHFAGHWGYITALKKKYKNLKKSFFKSNELLSRAVSLPIMINMNNDVPSKIKLALEKALK